MGYDTPYVKDPRDVGAFWADRDPNVTACTGAINDERVTLKENPEKTTDKHPDWLVFTEGGEKVGAFWNKAGKNGTFMSGDVRKQHMFLFTNDRRKSDKAPIFRAMLPRDAEVAPKPVAVTEDEVPF